MPPRHQVTQVVLVALLAALLWLAPTPWPSAAAEGVVTDCSDDTQFSSLLASGGTVTFDCGTALIPLSSSKVISANTTIDGGDQITLSGTDAHRLFEVSPAASLTLRNIVLTNGLGMGDGGAIVNRGVLTLEHSTIRESKSAASGGAIVSYGPLTITNSLLESNEALNGGALYPRFPAARTSITNSVLRNNSVSANELVSLDTGWGGAILAWDGVSITIEGTDIYNNSAARSGGGIYNFPPSEVSLSSSTLRDNVALVGGGLFNRGTAALTDSTLSGNSAEDAGGGIHNFGGTMTLTNVTLSGNKTRFGDGGGIDNTLGTTTLTSVTLSGNTAGQSGGVILNNDTTTLTNVTLSGNAASQLGGGIANVNGTTTLTSVTLAGNTAGQLGGGIYGSGSEVTVKNTIVANSPSGGNCAGPSIANAGFNLASDSSCGFNQVPNLLLGPLADNGGATRTHLPQPDSPAIDFVAVGCPPPSDDQRGAERPVDGDGNGSALCDAGAVEWTATPPSSPSAHQSYLPLVVR